MEGRVAYWPVLCRGGEQVAEQQAVIARANQLRAMSCAQCGATGVKLAACSTCRLAHYCSRACQRAGWKAHRPQCRAPGEHRRGDVVMLQSPSLAQPLIGQWALVVGSDPHEAGSWLVENRVVIGKEPLRVAQGGLRHVLTH